MSLDRDPALAFQVHRVEQLILFVAFVNRARAVEQSIGQRGLAVIDMRDDAKISGQLDRHKALHYAGASSVGQSEGGLGKCVIPRRADGEGPRNRSSAPARHSAQSPELNVSQLE